MFDFDLAILYVIDTKVLKQQVKRNIYRFPEDFMFQLSDKEFKILRSQIVISNQGGRRYKPSVFTEQGVAMLSSVLNSKRAIRVNIQIMRTFVKLRGIIFTYKELRKKIEKRYASKFKIVFDVINKLLFKEEENKDKEIGFRI